MVKTIQPPWVMEYDADLDAPEFDPGPVQFEPMLDADPDDFDDDGLDDDDAEFGDDEDDDDTLEDELEPDDLSDDV